MTVLTEEQMRDRLRQACKAAGGQAAFARSAGASPAYVSDVLSGKRLAGPKISSALGLTALAGHAYVAVDEKEPT